MPASDCQLFGGAVAVPFRLRQPLDNVGGVAVGHHTPRVFPRPVLVVGNLTQGDYRIHGSSVPVATRRESPSQRQELIGVGDEFF